VVKVTSSIEQKNDETQEESWMQYKFEYIVSSLKGKERKEKEMNRNEPNRIQSNWCWIESKGKVYICVCPNVGFLDDL
jgi:hypothetical protein